LLKIGLFSELSADSKRFGGGLPSATGYAFAIANLKFQIADEFPKPETVV
jgi:hypothetical protein